MSTFLLTTCHVGAESFLRAELARDGRLAPAFARPGLLTFKVASGILAPSAPRPHPLVRGWGVSLGRAATPAEAARLLEDVPWGAVLHVRPGEPGPPGHVPGKVLARWTDEALGVEEALTIPGRLEPGAARLGDPVVDVIVRPDEPWVFAHHVHDLARGPLPGGRWPLSPPEDAPSRAWSKLEELFAASGVAPRPGDLVLEIGSAPGGATVSLLDRGATVVAVDPKPYALPDRFAHAPFRQIAKAVEGVGRDELPDDVRWLVVDVSMAAPLAVRVLERLVPRYRAGLEGAFVTLKLNEWALADRIPGFLRQLAALGFARVEAASHPSFRQEVGVVALGLSRSGGPS